MYKYSFYSILFHSATVLINDIGIAMKTLGYSIYRVKIFKKDERSRFTYTFKCYSQRRLQSKTGEGHEEGDRDHVRPLLRSDQAFDHRLLLDRSEGWEVLLGA